MYSFASFAFLCVCSFTSNAPDTRNTQRIQNKVNNERKCIRVCMETVKFISECACSGTTSVNRRPRKFQNPSDCPMHDLDCGLTNSISFWHRHLNGISTNFEMELKQFRRFTPKISFKWWVKEVYWTWICTNSAEKEKFH